MPKLSKIQSNFTAGEISPNVYGRVDSERYDTSLQYLLNYMPILQGPLIRRPGTKYIANVKDSTKPPVLIPFAYSGTNTYVLEFGDQYIRFYANDGQVIASSNVFQVAGTFDQPKAPTTTLNFTALRPNTAPGPGENILPGSITNYQGAAVLTSSMIAAGGTLELSSPYSFADVANIRYAQNADTLFLFHSKYPPHKLQKKGPNFWDLKPLFFQDGPYLPLNSYDSIGDSVGISLIPNGSLFTNGYIDFVTGPNYGIFGTSNDGTGQIKLSLSATPAYGVGDRVFVSGVPGTTEANNGTSTIQASYWTVGSVSGSTIVLSGSQYQNAISGSGGTVFPALFQMTGSSGIYSDAGGANGGTLGSQYFGRNIGLINSAAIRVWGHITKVINPAHIKFQATPTQSGIMDASPITVWQLGVYNQNHGWPATGCFHQNRLMLSGVPGFPLEIDASQAGGNYEAFAASGSNLQVTDANALQFNLLATELSSIAWMRSAAQGLLAGTTSSEWQIAPNSQAAALTPTNFTAQQVASFGAAPVDAIQLGNAVIYMQAAQRRMREMNYFFQVGTFRSTNLSELAEHMTLPNVIQLAVQKEAHPSIWGIRQDGQLISLTYNRDDVSLKAGFSRHQLGGQSDTTGTQPQVKSMAVAWASSALFQQLWVTAQRSIAGSSVMTIEAMGRPFSDTASQEDAYYLDCGATFDNPIAVTGITNAASCVVTAPAHGFSNSSQVRFYSTFGMNTSTIDVNGISTSSNLLNYQVFFVGSTSANSFKIQDSVGNDINSQSYSAYLGSSVVRKLITHISGLTWLRGDTVGVLADGGIHPNVVVDSSASITLSYPAAKVQIGYLYNSDAQLLKTKEGSAQGTSIGSTRRVNRVAFMLHNVAELSVGPSFVNLLPVEFLRTDSSADSAVQLKDGIFREGFQGPYTFDDVVCFRQSAPLPGTIQSVVRFLEEQDV